MPEIMQRNTFGDVIKVWNSAQEAATALGDRNLAAALAEAAEGDQSGVIEFVHMGLP